MKFAVIILCVASTVCATAPARPGLRVGPLIDRFNSAACLHPSPKPPVWVHAITLQDGKRLRVQGDGGFRPRLIVQFEQTQQIETVAAMGDYFRITDVRIDPDPNHRGSDDAFYRALHGCWQDQALILDACAADKQPALDTQI